MQGELEYADQVYAIMLERNFDGTNEVFYFIEESATYFVIGNKHGNFSNTHIYLHSSNAYLINTDDFD